MKPEQIAHQLYKMLFNQFGVDALRNAQEDAGGSRPSAETVERYARGYDGVIPDAAIKGALLLASRAFNVANTFEFRCDVNRTPI